MVLKLFLNHRNSITRRTFLNGNVLKPGLWQNIKRHEALAGGLRLDWSVLNELEVYASAIRDRSRIFQRVYTKADTSVAVYVKIYTYKKHPFQRLARRGRSRVEARNLLFFKNIGIPAPRVIGWGQRRNLWGRLVEEFIITEAVPGALPLDVFVKSACPDNSRPVHARRREEIIDKISLWTRKIHDHNFFHNDLYWRNILAQINNEAIKLFWIDCPAGGFYPLPTGRHRKRLKDFATLDKLARLYCTKQERRRFVSGYLKCPEGSPEVERFSKAVSNYRRRRFDPGDDLKRAMAEGGCRQSLKDSVKKNKLR